MSIAILVVYAADVSIWVLPTCSIEGYFLRTKARHKSEKSLHIIRYSLLNTKTTSFLYIHDKATMDFQFQYDILEQEHAL